MPRIIGHLTAAYIAFIFVQSLFFKFSGADESIFIFSTIAQWSGIALFEPQGRFLIGFAELAASILLFIPGWRFLGGLMATGIMTGAIFFHLVSPLGIEVHGDGGLLFANACLVWAGGLATAWLDRVRLLAFLGQLRSLISR